MINAIQKDGFALKNTQVKLLPEKAAWLPAFGALLLADFHLDKSSFFQQNGIALPSYRIEADLLRFEQLLVQYKPKTVYFLGDLTHNNIGNEWLLFTELMQGFVNVRFVLIKGNHDRLQKIHYNNCGILVQESEHFPDFTLLHEPQTLTTNFHFSGHIHPGYKLYGKARQKIQLPCFALWQNRLVLPAFSSLTGLWPINSTKPKQAWLVTSANALAVVNKI